MASFDKRFLKKVILNADVYAVCLQHALSTEKEEVMGLLLGNVDEDACISHITACKILRRIDKQPDRVEISAEQLLSASEYAEKLSADLGKEVRVIGWYHSHPHITVWPSHVDIKTQSLYQMMEKYFVGIIFSVYPKIAEKSIDNQIQMTAFQSIKTDKNLEQLEINIVINKSPLNIYNLEALAALPKILVQEEVENHGEDNSECEDLLINLHNDAFKTLKHAHIIAKITRPVCEDLEDRLIATDARIKKLKIMKQSFSKGNLN